MVWIPRTRRALACGAGAFALTDAITGMTAYSVITLGALWFFSWSWLRIAAEAASRGVAFGSAAQAQWAWFGTVVTLPMIPVVLYLAIHAYRLPMGLAKEALHPRGASLRALVAGFH